MSPQDFLAAVLPPTGIYCVAELGAKKQHVYVKSVEEICAKAQGFAEQQKDAYFALASFKEPGSRLSDNASEVRSLWVDVDCGPKHAYRTKREGMQALREFLETSGLTALGDPCVVDSGGGLHVYWPLEDAMPVAVWQPVAEHLKRVCKRLGFNIDFTCTADASRVLRVPGTKNHKYSPARDVRIVLDGGNFKLDAISTVLSGTLLPPSAEETALTLQGTRPKESATEAKIKLFENSTVLFKDILLKTANGTGCNQLAFYIDNATEEGMEPLWRGLLSIAKVCADGERAAKQLSAMHPYEPARMNQKLREIKGPYPCTKFDTENPGVCQSCPHWGKITNPLALGRHVETETAAVPLTIEEIDASGVDVTKAYERPDAPKGFAYGKTGGVYREKVEEGQKVHVPIIPYYMFVVDVLYKEGAHVMHMVALRPEGAKDVVVPTKALVSKDDTVKVLAEQNILASFGAGNDKNLFDYVRAAYEDASLRIKASTVPSQYGWQTDGSFVLNGRILYPDGNERAVPMPELENLTMATRTSGTLEDWREVIRLMVQREMYEVLTLGCVGFGAPVMCFTGMRGMTFHAGHRESGTGKSLALSVAASVWGHPIDYRTGKSTSPVAMQQRAGNLNSLPFLSDELTMRARADAEWFPAFVFDFSEGRGKERMEANRNRERVNNTTWSSIAMFTSNTRMVDYMTGVRQASSEGELRRFLEWSPSKRLEFSAEEQRVVTSLQSNYGVAGAKYAKWLVGNRDTAKRITQQVSEKLFVEFKASNDERFWIAGAAAVVAGAILAGPKYADVVILPVEHIKNALHTMIKDTRKALASSRLAAIDVLNDYIREFYGQFIVLKRSTGGIMAQLANGEDMDKSLTRTRVMGRVEHNVTPGFVEFFIEEAMVRKHCALFGYGFTEFVEDLSRDVSVGRMRKDMLAGTRGFTMRVNAIKITKRADDVVAIEAGV